jgi:hypothetical protein
MLIVAIPVTFTSIMTSVIYPSKEGIIAVAQNGKWGLLLIEQEVGINSFPF